MVLLAGISTVLVFFGVARLYPGKRTKLVSPAVTDKDFVMVIDEEDATFDPEFVRNLLFDLHAIDVQERLTEETGK